MDTVAFFKTIRPTLEALTDEEAGALMKALFAHSDGEEVDLTNAPGAVRAVYPLIVDSTDRLNALRDKKSKAGSKHGTNVEQIRNIEGTQQEQTRNKRGTHNHNHNLITPTEYIKRFTPPTTADVAEYATEKGIRIDAQRFVDFYESKGWKVGTSPMKDWKAAVRNWSGRDKVVTNFDQRGTDYDALLREVL